MKDLDLWKTVEPRYGEYDGETIDHWNMTVEQKKKVVDYWARQACIVISSPVPFPVVGS